MSLNQLSSLISKIYKRNPNLKPCGVAVHFTEHQFIEYQKCCEDPVYFLETYGKVVSLDKGIVPFKLYPYQKRIIDAIHNNRLVLGKLYRQAGKSTIVAGYIAWYCLFNENKTCAILANKAATAKEIFSRVQLIIENTPQWLQQGVKTWNKTSFEFENGSRCFCAATSPSAVRGQSLNLLFCDEFAHLGTNLAEEFISSVFPTISSAQTSKLVIISTPKGMNHFYKLWHDAEKGENNFTAVEGFWYEKPGNDDAWLEQQRKILNNEVQFNQEFLCTFEGSSMSLINGAKLATLVFSDPIFNENNVSLFEKPIPGHSYVISVDVSRGQHLDSSAFSIIDVTTIPYKVVGIFKDNKISTLAYPTLIHEYAKKYNEAYCLIEINDIGGEVANTIWHEFEYEHVYFTHKNKVTEAKGYPGIRSTKKVKSIGCAVLKDMIENDKMIVNAFDIIQEMSVFVQKRTSYEAEDTSINDDLMTTLWLFAWLTKQPLFADITNVNIRKLLSERTEASIIQSLPPFGAVQTGNTPVETFADDNMKRWVHENVSKEDKWIFQDFTEN